MIPVVCEKCGHPLTNDALACAHCGYASKNGTVPEDNCLAKQVVAPEGRDGMTIYPVPREVLDWARATFNEEDYVAALREIGRTGGVELKDFIHELEQGALPRE
jgi:hypothetical protein